MAIRKPASLSRGSAPEYRELCSVYRVLLGLGMGSQNPLQQGRPWRYYTAINLIPHLFMGQWFQALCHCAKGNKLRGCTGNNGKFQRAGQIMRKKTLTEYCGQGLCSTGVTNLVSGLANEAGVGAGLRPFHTQIIVCSEVGDKVYDFVPWWDRKNKPP